MLEVLQSASTKLLNKQLAALVLLASGLFLTMILLGASVLDQYSRIYATPEVDMSSEMGALRLTFVLFIIVVGVITVMIINSVRKRLETEAMLKTSAARLHHRALQLQLAAEIARDATADLDLDIVLNQTVRLVKERFNFYHVGIFLIDDAGEYAVLRAAAGAEQLLEEGHRLKVNESGIVGHVTGSGNPRLAPDVHLDNLHIANPLLSETRSELTLPFKVGSRIIGALDVHSKQVAAFDSEDVIILQTMADLLAIAIDKARLHGEVQRHANELEQRVHERTLQVEHERAQLTAILESMGEGVIYEDKFGNRYVNQALSHITGYDNVDWKGYEAFLNHDIILDADPQTLDHAVRDAVYNENIWRGEVRLRNKGGSELDAGLTCTKVMDANGRWIGTVTILRDISQEKALQRQKSRFVADASHELRTPITNLKTRIYLMRRQPEQLTEHLAVLEQVTNRMGRLVEKLLDMSRFERGIIELQHEHINLQELVKAIVDLQRPEAENKNITLNCHLAPEALRVSVDADRITQVVTNLVTNAINYTPIGGKITVQVYARNKEAVIEIEDTGIGIPAEALDHLFQPFFRANNSEAKGTGLGLSISKQIVDLHGGNIMAESTVGQGSRFSVCLPL